ncbi:MAG: hypothetical protein MI725_16920 [Pirellulales bacterium]|nr:hypothetical protein [Pirellulales bacterium]
MPKRVSRKVRFLRWLVRLYVGLEGLAAVLLLLGAAFWLGLALDWIFEPSPIVRLVVLGAVLLATVYVAARFLVSRAVVRLPNSSLALLLERNYPELDESLVTTVEAADRRRFTPLGSAALLDRTSKTASEGMRRVRLRRIFQLRPLVWKSAVALGLAFSIVAFALFQSEVFGFWLQRLRLSESPWPRRVQLSVIGFERDGDRWVANVARDADFELRALASILDGHSAPEQIEIRYQLADGRRGRHAMTKIGKALPGRDEAQEFRFTFHKVAEDLSFDVVGGDDRIRSLRLHVVERPQIIRTTMECEFPSYMRRPAQSRPFSGRVELPEGSRAICRVETNKPLREATVHEPAEQHDLPVDISKKDARHFSFSIDVGPEDRILLITMLDHDGVENREPYRVVLSAVPDEPPEVSVQVRGIGSAVTPQAVIPFVGRITDQYGVEEVWFEYQVDQNPPGRRIPPAQPGGRLEFTQLEPLDLVETESNSNRRLLDLQPGQQLSLAVQARDAYDLQDEPHVGSSQRFLLKIVTDSELRALLEKRELGLRQRFEAIYEKMLGVQELLGRIDVTRNVSSAEDRDEQQKRQRERDLLRIGGAMQNVTQLAYETIGVSEGFEDIVAELVNNRVETEELKERLLVGITAPLREIGEELMPALEQRIQQLQTAYHREDSQEVVHRLAIAQGELVLEAMKQVLDRMLELESYNELVELLRGIVNDHQQLQKQTKEQRRQKLRSLLDED